MRHMVVDVSDHLLPVSVNSASASEGQLSLHCDPFRASPAGAVAQTGPDLSRPCPPLSALASQKLR